MASLEHVSVGGRNHWRLRFSLDKKRQRLGLGDVDEAGAMLAKEHVEHLVGQYKRNRPPAPSTAEWLEGLPIEVHDRLAALGLVEARKRAELPRTVLAFMRAYIESRTDWKKPENYRQAVDHLEGYLKRDSPLGGVTKGDVERWHRWMIEDKKGPGLSSNTAGQNVKRCRQMMRQALDDGLIEVNPFLGIKIDLRSDTSKNRFIDSTTATAILAACPDQEWRTIYALCRWAGLRCPSEVLRLRWTDIQWDRGRFKVTAPKTERYGKGERIVPLWPEVRTELDDLFSIVGPGVDCAADAYVIQRYRCSEANLRTTFNKIVERAGVTVFPKPFMAQRASRRTELERSGKHANHVLNDWFGHSGAIAETHYLSVTEADFTEATSPQIVPPSSLEGTPEGTSTAMPDSSGNREGTKKPGVYRVMSVPDDSGFSEKYTPEDSNL
ncbi:Integrase [Neorhodopirellula lusitana]|uniref:Integrase n=1 Tax=Neorhodopirellula lusitana TaxID=445327 RepID=A0ABY1PU57_9BACT|nr:phage integrase SAM-like domain-containing protein [Neorhodopirellula lusitana]SMP41651.1 Integrase [Neorhodopirellula lusitana]